MSAPVLAEPTQEHAWLGLENAAAWDEVADAAGADIFHRAWFHRLANRR